MAPQDDSPQRKEAHARYRRAQDEAARRRLPRAEQLIREAIELDGTFVEARLWAARLYEQMSDPRQASREYQAALHSDKDNAEAWRALERLDPAAADRLRRVSEIAPDPFLQSRQRGATSSDPLADMETLGGEAMDAGGVADFGRAHTFGDGVAGDISDFTPTPQAAARPQAHGSAVFAEIGGGGAAPAQPSGPARGAVSWEYEQDRPMLERWLEQAPVQRLATAIRAMWAEPNALESVYNYCAHVDRGSHKALLEVARKSAASLGIEEPKLYVIPERQFSVIAIQDGPPTLGVPTGIIRGLPAAGQRFLIGRALHTLRAGYLAEWLAAEVILNRHARTAVDLGSTIRDLIRGRYDAWLRAIGHDETERLRGIGHAWQQRVTLSADRAGLIAARDPEAACAAAVKSAMRSADAAASATVETFMRQFVGRDAAKLAGIPPEESPDHSEPYAAYRLQMLKWWAGTPEGRALLASPG